MSSKTKNFNNIDELFEVIGTEPSKRNNLLEYIKRNKHLHDDLLHKTKYLDNQYLAQPLTQRIYHYKNGMNHPVPTHSNGWYVKFENFKEGYNYAKQQTIRNSEWDELTDQEIEKYILSSKGGIKHKVLKEWLNKQTSFLDPYNANIKTRTFYYRKQIKYPIVDYITKKLAYLYSDKQANRYKSEVENFLKLSEQERKDYFKTILNLDDRVRAAKMQILRFCTPITDYLDEQLRDIPELLSSKKISQIIWHFANSVNSLPKCDVCKKTIRADQFNFFYMKYPLTCSHHCNNKCLQVIEKRLTNNNTNAAGYKTNTGKHEKYLLNLIAKTKKLNLLTSKRIGPFFADGLDEDKKLIVEIQEPTHAYSRQFEKDKRKISFLVEKGYKVLLVLDNWFNAKRKGSVLQNKYKQYFETIPNVSVINVRTIKGKILNNEGWSEAIGVKKTTNNTKALEITTKTDRQIVCTEDHLIYYEEEKHKPAKDFKLGDFIFTIDGIDTVKHIKNVSCREMYDIIETDNNTFYANGIKVHNCICLDEGAFIDAHLIDEFWASVIPAISSGKKSKLLMVSTPNGVGNKFYEIYSGAESGKLERWKAERVDWWEIPGRDENWKKDMIEVLGSEEKFLQEFNNTFLDSASSAVGALVIERFKREKLTPIWVSEEEDYQIFEYPDPSKLYAIGVDVGEGIGRAASVAQVLDITDLQNINQVAVYGSNTIEPYHFANKLNIIGNSWGVPPMLIERNNCGAQVIDALYHNHMYEKLVSYNKISEKETYNRTRNIGVLSHTNIKFDGVQNMRYWVNHLQVVKINDPATISEFETFVRHPNGTFKKRNDHYFDDRIMALVWALFILEPIICEQYFTVENYDNQHKPLKIATNGYWENIAETYTLKDLSKDSKIITRTDTVAPNPSNQQTDTFFRDIDIDNKYDLDMESLLEQGYNIFNHE